jgi:pilus assembly protein CpaB
MRAIRARAVAMRVAFVVAWLAVASLIDWGRRHGDLPACPQGVPTTRIVVGEPVLPGKLAAKDTSYGIPAILPGNMRALAVRVDDETAGGGFLHPDDRVDVIKVIHPRKPKGAQPIYEVILRNVKVLAVGKELGAPENMVDTLLVNAEQADTLALASREGRIVLTLRSWGEEGPPLPFSTGLPREDGEGLSIGTASAARRARR